MLITINFNFKNIRFIKTFRKKWKEINVILCEVMKKKRRMDASLKISISHTLIKKVLCIFVIGSNRENFQFWYLVFNISFFYSFILKLLFILHVFFTIIYTNRMLLYLKKE